MTLIPVITLWALGMPMGYLAGSVFVSQNNHKEMDFLPIMAAIITPLGSILSVYCLFKSFEKENS